MNDIYIVVFFSVPLSFYFHLGLFAFASFLLVRAILRRNWEEAGNYFILASFAFIGLCYQLPYNGTTEKRIGFVL